ncbi:DUF421 domain-containing protein [Eubacteriales bacterium OttesenSCG-928-K08]|nr:DUF421 domain-containing protein [Eubacteriales bacterium OttesenSCG-928-K08]
MFVLFLRAIILYVVVFCIIRLMGKRQISQLQPFDLIFTLLVADLASNPIGDTSVPLMYGIIPILALFLMQQLIAYLSLKSGRARRVLSGKPQIVIARGVLQEDVMRNARYTINDLMEQLRGKDIFDISEVSYAIIETDGDLSVLLNGDMQAPRLKDFKLKAHDDELGELVVLDGKLHAEALASFGKTEQWLCAELKEMGFSDAKQLFLASLSPGGKLFVQTHKKYGSVTRSRQTAAKAGRQHG